MGSSDGCGRDVTAWRVSVMRRDVDLVIRSGRVIDGTGAEPFEADIAV